MDLATDTLEVGDIQSVQHVESVLPVGTDLWNALMMRTWWGLWAGQVMCEDQSAEKLNGSGAASTRTAGSVTRCWNTSTTRR